MSEITLHLGDCLSVMATMPENSVDSVITDPPYGLVFMGKDWDKGVPGVAFWREALRVAKPGAILLAFGGTRTYHRLACAIEDAGWQIRDTLAWVYGSGFPKSYDISKGIDKQAGAEREVVGKYESPENTSGGKGRKFCHGGQPLDGLPDITAPATQSARDWQGWGTALKPAFEPIVVAMKPIDGTYVNNALTYGVAGFWIDGGRVGINPDVDDPRLGGNGEWHITREQSKHTVSLPPKIMGSNVLGRFPANFIHDGSDEVTALFPQTTSGKVAAGTMRGLNSNHNVAYADIAAGTELTGYGDSGSAARFFYCAKASRSERNAGLEGMEAKSAESITGRKSNTVGLTTNNRGDESGNPFCGVSMMPRANNHPTVKPLALMRYLARLTKTPTGGVVLDPFVGSGTTGVAAVLEGRDFIGIDIDAEYLGLATKRIQHAQGLIPVEMPLFEGVSA